MLGLESTQGETTGCCSVAVLQWPGTPTSHCCVEPVAAVSESGETLKTAKLTRILIFHPDATCLPAQAMWVVPNTHEYWGCSFPFHAALPKHLKAPPRLPRGALPVWSLRQGEIPEGVFHPLGFPCMCARPLENRTNMECKINVCTGKRPSPPTLTPLSPHRPACPVPPLLFRFIALWPPPYGNQSRCRKRFPYRWRPRNGAAAERGRSTSAGVLTRARASC